MIHLRPAQEADLLFMFKTRNLPEVYQGFYSQKAPLSWHEHLGWWSTRPSSWQSFIIQLDDVPIGVINVGQQDHWSPELGWFLHPDYWGKGYCKEALKIVFEYLKERGYKYCHTTIKWENERSTNLAHRLGFTPMGGAREGEIWLTKDLTVDYQI